eukprot:3991019-Pleurochrysis_carterae.AAC.3
MCAALAISAFAPCTLESRSRLLRCAGRDRICASRHRRSRGCRSRSTPPAAQRYALISDLCMATHALAPISPCRRTPSAASCRQCAAAIVLPPLRCRHCAAAIALPPLRC